MAKNSSFISEYDQDDLRDPDMTTIAAGHPAIGTASSDILGEEKNFPTLEPGFDLLSDDWFRVEKPSFDGENESINLISTTTAKNRKNNVMKQKSLSKTAESLAAAAPEMIESEKEATTSEKFMLYYPISGTPFFSFHPKLEIASIVKK